jgi:2-haloacid dehalogenase
MSLDFDRFEALTFDCYGTLIDWETGILRAMRELAGDSATDLPDDDTILELFGRLEAEAETGAFRPYREVLQDVAAGFGLELGLTMDGERASAFARSVPDWPPFTDSAPALEALAGRFRLAIVSNVDDDLFAGSAERLGVPFDEVVTAQQVRSYKPATPHFDEVLKRLGTPRERVLHVAQSLYHDVAPAKTLGFACVWVNRRAGRRGSGATRRAIAAPDLEVPDLATLVRTMGIG